MRILSITPDDIPALSTLAARTFSDTFAHLYPPEDLTEFIGKSYNHDTLLAQVADQNQFWRIAWNGRQAVGYLHAGPVGLPHADADPATQGEVKRLYIDSSQQGKGLGKQLLKLALDHLSDRYGHASQWIGVWSENHRAQALYLSHGFVRAGEYGFPVGQTIDREYILRRY